MGVDTGDITGAICIILGLFLCMAGARYVERTFVLLMILAFTILFFVIIEQSGAVSDLSEDKFNLPFAIVMVCCVLVAIAL